MDLKTKEPMGSKPQNSESFETKEPMGSKPQKPSGFRALGVKEDIVTALQQMGIYEPTTIQQKAIPLALAGKDVVGMSRTGSGKTVAFSVPILERIEKGQGVQALIIAPTRELVVQIAGEIEKFGKHKHFIVASVYGGVGIDPQIRKIERAEIIVGTPGRLLDHLQRSTLDLSKLRFAVLDEADKMVEMGFIEDVDKILSCSSKDRQVLLFGATLSDEIDNIKHRYMKDPEVARAEIQVKKDFLEQYYYNVKHHEKFSLLVHLLKNETTHRVMIFCSTRSTVELVTKNLRANGLRVEMLHGKMVQNKRLRVIENFHKGKPNILIASAVAARGLDIKDVTHVFNYDLSQDPQEYVHRVGRTARAGEAGKAITLLSDRDYDTFSQILNRNRFEVTELQAGKFPRLQFDARVERRGFSGRPSGRFGSRPSFGGRDGPRRGPSRGQEHGRKPRAEKKEWNW
jgi:superfamily II DNA/RNA helicase